jgi:hypothetical protein
VDRAIRVDQSYCNRMVSDALQRAGWAVLFRDPGRCSRGVGETQGALLQLFERLALPIPDIAAVRAGELIFVEVDASIARASPSFQIYRQRESEILDALGCYRANELRLAFCKTTTSRPRWRFGDDPRIDAYLWFEDASLIHTISAHFAPLE